MPDLPNGLDRADGVSGRIGTRTPSSALKVKSAGGTGASNAPVEEFPDSPEIERAEQATLTHRFSLSWTEALTRLAGLGRGTLLFDSVGDVTKVLSSKVQYVKGGMATLSVVAESVSFDSPPDTFQITPVELGVNIMKHPRYFYAFLGEGQGSATELANQMVIRLLQDYFENPTAAYRDALTTLLHTTSPGDVLSTGLPKPVGAKNENGSYDFTPGVVSGTAMAKRAALEIIQKYWRGEETPYVVGYEIKWSAYYFRPQWLNPGGYVEDPMLDANPQLPDYFFSVAWPPDPAFTIFDQLANDNPQCYSDTGYYGGNAIISWLRKADQMEYERTWFKIDRTWIGSPVGFWDEDLYTANARPHFATDYHITDSE